MGGGFGIAVGLAKVANAPVVGHLGDSTFFHAGIPPMINAVFNNADVTLVILDNSTTAMTGFQPHPGAPFGDQPKIMPEDIARACGVKFVEIVDPFNLAQIVDTLERSIRHKGPAVVISRRACSILEQREKRRQGIALIPYRVDPEKCDDCGVCINLLGCPAIIKDNDKVIIDSSQCPGCGLCAQVCPKKAIIQG
jgi:indolepyruvate ferredoxin oxidoreductase alpha subunit